MVANKLAERIHLVLDWRGWSAREWADRAGLSPNTVNAFLRRARANPQAALRSPILSALAKAASLDQAWLLSGEGEPEIQLPTLRGKDARGIVEAIAVADGVAPEILDRYRALRSEKGRPLLYWMARLLEITVSLASEPKTLPTARAR